MITVATLLAFPWRGASGPEAGAGRDPGGSDSADVSGAAAVVVQREVAFLEADRAERLDLYLTAGHTRDSRAPAVVWIHGGGWTGGSKAARRERNVCTTLAAAGYVCASIDYRLGEGAWPQNLLDAKTAVRFLRARATELGIDPERIAVAGGSAGAHLALMVAYTAGDPALEPAAPYAGVSSSVDCVVELYGPTHLLTRQETMPDGALTGKRRPAGPRAVFAAVSGGDEVFHAASPVARVTPTSPPTLILHGRADTTVDHGQALELAQALRDHGVPHELVLLDGVGHTFDFAGWKDRPLPRDSRAIVVAFLERHLR